MNTTRTSVAIVCVGFLIGAWFGPHWLARAVADSYVRRIENHCLRHDGHFPDELTGMDTLLIDMITSPSYDKMQYRWESSREVYFEYCAYGRRYFYDFESRNWYRRD